MVNREDIAKYCGVSPMTVTRVVTGKGYVSKETRQKVLKAIEELGYIPNRIASNLTKRKSNEIAIILPDLTNSYYLQVIDAMIKESKKFGFVNSIFKANESELPEVLEEIISNRVAGIVNYVAAFPPQYIKALQKIGTKVIRQNYFNIEFDMSLSFNEAIEKAIDSLVQKGAKEFFFVSGMSWEYSFSDPRINIFLDCLKQKGLKSDHSRIILGDYPNEKAYLVGQIVAEQLIDKGQKVDAVFCINDSMAFGFIKGLKEKNYKVPRDVAVVGFDNTYLSSIFQPTLSTIAADIEQEARLYVNYIAGVKSENTFIKAHFIERESTKFWSKID